VEITGGIKVATDPKMRPGLTGSGQWFIVTLKPPKNPRWVEITWGIKVATHPKMGPRVAGSGWWVREIIKSGAR
jgi:hypothetical protein